MPRIRYFNLHLDLGLSLKHFSGVVMLITLVWDKGHALAERAVLQPPIWCLGLSRYIRLKGRIQRVQTKNHKLVRCYCHRCACGRSNILLPFRGASSLSLEQVPVAAMQSQQTLQQTPVSGLTKQEGYIDSVAADDRMRRNSPCSCVVKDTALSRQLLTQTLRYCGLNFAHLAESGFTMALRSIALLTAS